MIHSSIEALEIRIAPASLSSIEGFDPEHGPLPADFDVTAGNANGGVALPALSVNDPSVVEGNTGTIDLVFTVSLSVASPDVVTVKYTTVDGAAVSEGSTTDYQADAGTLTFAAGETSKTVAIRVNGDAYKEANETLDLRISNATNASIADNTGRGTISDDGDTIVALTIDDVKIVEGDGGTKIATFHVQLSGSSDQNTTFTVATRNGTAQSDEDFEALNMDFQIDAGATSVDIQVTINGDLDFESTENFFVDLNNPSVNVQVIDGEGRGTIFNEDIQQVNKHIVRYVDEDGDLATVKVTKGNLTIGGVLVFSAPNGIGGRILQRIDFTGAPQSFNDSASRPLDLSVTAEEQPGFVESGGTSNGKVDVGFIRAGIPRPELLQIFNNIDFRNITIEGDLGKIIAGDQLVDRAVRNLTTLSQGARGTATGAPDNECLFLAGIKSVKVEGDWFGLLQTIGGDLGDIENLKIGGALRGGSGGDSGQIFFTGTLIKATIGSIIGGSGLNSGSILGNFISDATPGATSRIGVLQILGDVTGGVGNNSGQVLAPNVGTVIVGTESSPGNLRGGDGVQSGVIAAGVKLGKITINGDVVGGSDLDSGEIFAGSRLGNVQITGSLTGGGGENSGSVISEGSIRSLTILKNIDGGIGIRSGSVQITGAGPLTEFRLGNVADATSGNLKGGEGDASGTLILGGDFVKGVLAGSIVGGSGNNSGGLNVSGFVKRLEIAKDLTGGSSSEEGTLGGSEDVVNSGYLTAGRIGSLFIGGNIEAGTNNGTHLSGSGAIRAAGDIASLAVGGDIVGNDTQRVVIAAAGGGTAGKNKTVGSLTVNGDTAFADIMGGYGIDASGVNSLGNLSNADAQIGTVQFTGSVVATNVVAGVSAGPDGRFGTSDDEIGTGEGINDDPGIQSRIAKLIVLGPIVPNEDIFGVVAQVVGAKNVTGDDHILTDGIDEFEFNPAGSNFRLRELSAG
jgi:hypothetical protein